MQQETAETQWVSFYLDQELFACPIQSIQEIIPYQEPIPVPGSAEAIEGVLNVRGEIIPVVCGSQLAGVTPKTKEENTDGKIIIIESPLGLLGMTIDSVSQIIDIPPEEIQYEEAQNSSINGSALYEGRLIILLDIQPQAFCSPAQG